MSSDIAEAKRKLQLPALLHQIGLGEHAKKSARCPFHDDKNNSFSIFRTNGNGSWRWKCFACDKSGDEIDFLAKLEGLSKGEAIRRYCDLAGVNGSKPPMGSAFGEAKAIMQREPVPTKPGAFDWQSCIDALSPEYLEKLSKWRGFTPQFCAELHEKKLIGLHDGLFAFPVYDASRNNIVAAHVRAGDGNCWFYHPQGTGTTPLVIGKLIPGEVVHVFESTWDGLAFLDVSGDRSGVVIARGSSNATQIAPLISECSCCVVWTQNDAAGTRFEKDLVAATTCPIKRAKVPEQYKDLNDWTRAGTTTDELFAAVVNAEVIRQSQKTWLDALNESVVTSSELHELQLTPRKKLLGDWFCEGDLGFIFAFRGVGKTWLALAIARALSAGDKLGDWQAHEAVKVLYVDGEMPPDLIRDRCEGLKGSTAANLEFLNHEILFERTGKVLNITKSEVQQAITQRCVRTGSKVLVLDNLSTLASGMRENEADSWELVNNWLLDLRRRKIAVVIVHHAGRSGEMRGTSKREDNVFWIIALEDAKKDADDKRGAQFISRFTKPSRNTQEEMPAYEWHFLTDESTGLVSVRHKLAQTMDVFLGLIEDGVTECGQIAQEMKTSPATISRLAKRAIDAGKIIKKSREYFLAEGQRADKNDEI